MSELACLGREGLVVAGEFLGDGGLKGVVSIGALQERDQRFDDELGIEGWHPGVLDGLSTDLTCVLLHIGVIDLGLEEHLWSLEGVVVAEVDVDDEHAALVGGVLRPQDLCIPVGQVVPD